MNSEQEKNFAVTCEYYQFVRDLTVIYKDLLNFLSQCSGLSSDEMDEKCTKYLSGKCYSETQIDIIGSGITLFFLPMMKDELNFGSEAEVEKVVLNLLEEKYYGFIWEFGIFLSKMIQVIQDLCEDKKIQAGDMCSFMNQFCKNLLIYSGTIPPQMTAINAEA